MNTILSYRAAEQPHAIQNFQYPPSGIDRPAALADLWQNEMTTDSTWAIPSNHDLRSCETEQCMDDTPSPDEVDTEFERGRSYGYVEGRSAERAEISAELRKIEADHVERALDLNEQFARERERYIESIGPEVVKLALSVASLILRREVQIDPLLLTSSVRVALRGVAAKTSVKIHVPAESADLWSHTVNHLPNLSVKPAVVPDDLLRNGECRLETEMGSADLGVQSQLAEIARILLGERRDQERQDSSLPLVTRRGGP